MTTATFPYHLFEMVPSTDLGFVNLEAPVTKGDFIIVRTEDSGDDEGPVLRREPLYLEVSLVWHEDRGPARLYVRRMNPMEPIIPPNLRPVPSEPYR